MAITNRERVGKALDLLNEGLLPFVERELQAVYADRWQEIAREGQPAERGRGRPGGKAGGTPAPRSAGGTPAPRLAGGTPAPQKPHLDCHALLTVMWNQWNPVFSKTLGQAERSLVNELRDVRNNWAHQKAFSGNDAYRALDSMERMLTAVSAGQKPVKSARCGWTCCGCNSTSSDAAKCARPRSRPPRASPRAA